MVKLSVIIPIYKVENYIIECLESICCQLIEGVEVILVNDGTPDNSMLLARSYISERYSNFCKQFIFIDQENQGQSVARNNALKICTGDYIAFLDSDDVWHAQKMEVMLQFALKYDLDFLYHLYSPLPSDEEICLENIILKKKKRYSFVLKNFIATPTVFVRKNKFPGFPEHLSYCEDYCCWLMSIQSNFYFIDKPLANGFKKPLGESGLSSNIYKMHKGFIDALLYLREKKKISLVFFLLAYIFEYLKFPLRYFR